MSCAHCFRGDAQDVDIDLAAIDALLNQTQVIGSLLLTGGEPLLNIPAMSYVLEGMIARKIPLMELSIITNGSKYSKEFVALVEKYSRWIDVSHKVCTGDYSGFDVDRVKIGISFDKYHTGENVCMTNYTKYKKDMYSFAEVLKDGSGDVVLAVGRGVDIPGALSNGLNDDLATARVELLDKDHKPVCPMYRQYKLCEPDQKIICCAMYMNVYGMLSTAANGKRDFVMADQSDTICNVTDADIWESVLTYNHGRGMCAKVQAGWMNNHVQDLQVPKYPEIEQTRKEKRDKGSLSASINEAMQMYEDMKDWATLAAAASKRDYSVPYVEPKKEPKQESLAGLISQFRALRRQIENYDK